MPRAKAAPKVERPGPAAVGLGAKLVDDETRAMLYEGVSASQLSTIFGIRPEELRRLLMQVEPCGMRVGYPIYQIKDAAPYLIPASKSDVESALKRMSPKDLPTALTKEYWAGQHARLKYEEDSGDLWRTTDVIEILAEVFKTLRMNILLFRDHVGRESDLTERQIDIIQTLTDRLLNDLADHLVERFKDGAERSPEDGEDAVDSAQDDDL